MTVSFLILACCQLTHVLFNEVTKNLWIWGALLLCAGIVLLGVYAPSLSDILRVEAPGVDGWLTVGTMSLVPPLIGQSLRVIRLRHT